MFPKLEQRSWIRIDVARCRSTQECFQGTCEALPHFTVARWVKAFPEDRDAAQDNHRTGRSNNTVHFLASLLAADRRWTTRELAAEVGVCHKTVLHILHDNLGSANLHRVGYP